VILEDGAPPGAAGAAAGAAARQPAPRLDFQWERAVVPVPPPRRSGGVWSSLGLLGAGAAVLVLGLSALDAANFVAAQFARADWLGWLTLGVAGLGYGLVGWAVAREWRGLLALRAVDRARAAFARQDAATAKAEAIRWAARLPAAQPVLPALREAHDTETLRAILQAGPLATLDAQAQALGRNAALQSFAVAAISPSPGLDAVLIGWRGIRLVRQVAVLHGLRPGLAGTIALLRRTLLDAATVAATDVAMDTATRALLTNPLLEKLAGEAATGAVAARRMLLLARAAAEACRIIPRTG
jgi:putative membrane protein